MRKSEPLHHANRDFSSGDLQNLDSGAFPTVAIEARLRKYQKLVEHCTYGMLQCQADGTIVDAGPSAGGELGLSAREQVGQNLAELVHPEDRRLVADMLERSKARHALRVTAEYRMRTEDGGWRWTEATATNLLHDPDVGSIVVTQRGDGGTQAAALDELSQRCAALASELSVFSDISSAVLSDGDIVTALTDTLSGCLETCEIAAGVLYLLDDEGRFRVTALGSDQGWDREQLATFFGHERLLRQIISGNVPTELPSSAVPESASLEVLHGCASDFVVVIPLRGESGPLGACVLASRIRHANQQGFLRFAAGVSNQITQVLALASALAEKEKLRREASEQARLMRLILDNMAEGVLVIDRERRVLLQNKSTLSLLPALRENLSERAGSLDMYRADGKTPLTIDELPLVRALNGESLDDAEVCIRPRDSSEVVRLYGTARPLVTESGELRGAMVVFRDITEQRRVEQEILESRSQWQSLVEHAPDFVLKVDREGIVRFINRVAPGFEVADVLGTPLGAGVPPEEHEKIRRALDDCILRGEPTSYEIPTAAPDGGIRWYSSVLGPIRRNGEITGAVVIARDITEKKLTDSQLISSDRMASLGALASGIAHEINSPLASLFVNLTLACRDAEVAAAGHELCAPLLEELNDTREAAERMRQIVHDLRIFTARDGERRGAVNVEELLESTLRSARYEIRHRAKLATSYAKVPLVRADEARLGQVFLNLVLNATQAIREGNAPGNEIRVTTSLDDADRVVVRIADTGEGIPLEAQGHVFTPLFTTKPRGLVTGLGLSVCQKIVAELGGEITFRSEVGKGTEFRVVLPRSPDEMRPAAEKGSPQPPVESRCARVLVIDDEPAVAAAIRRVLAPQHDITVVDSGARALGLLQGGARFDVVFCDVLMPQMSGIDLYQRVVQELPEQAKRFVFVTGGSFTARAQDFLDSVPNPRVEKPFNILTLRSLVGELMSHEN